MVSLTYKRKKMGDITIDTCYYNKKKKVDKNIFCPLPFIIAIYVGEGRPNIWK